MLFSVLDFFCSKLKNQKNESHLVFSLFLIHFFIYISIFIKKKKNCVIMTRSKIGVYIVYLSDLSLLPTPTYYHRSEEKIKKNFFFDYDLINFKTFLCFLVVFVVETKRREIFVFREQQTSNKKFFLLLLLLLLLLLDSFDI